MENTKVQIISLCLLPGAIGLMAFLMAFLGQQVGF